MPGQDQEKSLPPIKLSLTYTLASISEREIVHSFVSEAISEALIATKRNAFKVLQSGIHELADNNSRVVCSIQPRLGECIPPKG